MSHAFQSGTANCAERLSKSLWYTEVVTPCFGGHILVGSRSAGANFCRVLDWQIPFLSFLDVVQLVTGLALWDVVGGMF